MARHLHRAFTLLALAASLAAAQDATASLDNDSTPTDATAPPSHTDNAGEQDDGGTHPGGLYSYYLIFIALIICVVGVAGFLTYRRKKRRGLHMQQSRQSALQQDLTGWNAVRTRQRYWHGRWISADMSREEGLNEQGEAPPPYIKNHDEESGPHSTTGGPAVPMQTLSREQAGLKPPEYAEVTTHPVTDARASSASVADSPDRPAPSVSPSETQNR